MMVSIQDMILLVYFSDNRPVTPAGLVRVDLDPVVPVPGEPTLVTCSSNMTDVQTIEIRFQGGQIFDLCRFFILDNQTFCYAFGIHVSMLHKKHVFFVNLKDRQQ